MDHQAIDLGIHDLAIDNRQSAIDNRQLLRAGLGRAALERALQRVPGKRGALDAHGKFADAGKNRQLAEGGAAR